MTQLKDEQWLLHADAIDFHKVSVVLHDSTTVDEKITKNLFNLKKNMNFMEDCLIKMTPILWGHGMIRDESVHGPSETD